MPLEQPTTDPTDLYYRDRILAIAPFDRVEFAKTFEHRRVHVQGVNLHYVIGGQGPVIVFGHGWPASWYEWRKVMPQLADRFTCVAFDMPGLGDSSPPSAFDTGTISTIIKTFITEHLEQDQVLVVGHDVSGPPLAHMAAYNPELVEKLFFTETSIDGPEMGEILLQHINEIWHFPMNAARLSPSFASGREEQFIPQFFTQWVYNVGAIQPEDIAEYVRTAKIPGVIECGASYYNRPPAYTPDGNVLPEKSLTMPLKYIGADLGFGGYLGGDAKRAFKTLERYAIDASYEVVNKCSHWVSEDRPVYIAEKIANFFSAIARP
ncbi:MAG: alpha/beta hydrolase [Stenomitos rutilans HA7619-LM2]|jgi:pimeloyl-ACP methyl ester carboxylesterase|nr:alpha/beta hydrolase [Stenomitos rutilans HA7619-LM2]